MTLFTKKPVTVEASQWFKNGDHPQDHKPFETNGRTSTETDCLRYSDYLQTEGRVVRRYRHPDVSGNKICEQCGNPHHVHGWVDTLEQGHRVCPGDWIITGINGERYPCKPDVFEATYTPAQAEPAPAPVGEYPALALEAMEPVACLVNADLGAMVWPISDIGEAGTYCDEGEFPELLYPAATVSALQARIAELDAQVASLVADIAHADSLLSAGNDKGDYFNIETEMCWLSWQAAIAYAMAEAVKACEADRLDDTTGTEGDAAYNRAIGHCITAIKEALK